MMEVKGVGQKIPRREVPTRADTHFEEVFDASKKQLADAAATGKDQTVDPRPESSIDTLRSPYLDNNPLFKDLKGWMEDFRLELGSNMEQLSEHKEPEPIPDYHLRVTLYDCLKKLLCEIVNTDDRNLQMNYLRRVYEWFAKRQEKKLRTGRKEVGLLQQSEFVEPRKYIEVVPNRQLYEEQRRTIHTEIPPPGERLNEFDHRELKSDRPTSAEESARPESSGQHKLPAIVPAPPLVVPKVGEGFTQRERKKAAVTAKSNFLYYEPQLPEEQKMERMWVLKKNKDIADKRVAEEFQEVTSQWGRAKERVNENITRRQENLCYGNNFAVRDAARRAHRPQTSDCRKRPVDFKQVYEASSSEEEDVLSSPAPHAKQTQTQRQAQAQDQPRQPIVADLTAERPTTTQPKTRKLLYNAATAIHESDKMKVDYVRRMYGHLIGESNLKMEPADNIFVTGPKGTKTLSLYNKDVQRPYTVSGGQRSARELPITHQGSREQFRTQQLKEIQKLKEHLAKAEIPCSMVTLQRALLIPEDYPTMRMTAQNFLQPGSRLIVNPFAKKKKKKKSKKGGKGKGKGKASKR
jgi:hypothetical protein